MKIKKIVLFLTVAFTILDTNAQEKKYRVHTVAFYNFENLFDTINNPNNDDE